MADSPITTNPQAGGVISSQLERDEILRINDLIAQATTDESAATALATTVAGKAATAVVPKVYRPEAYGAVGNGTTDDSAAIQAAITAGAGGIVQLDGNYACNSTLTIAVSGTKIVGAGKILSGVGGPLFSFRNVSFCELASTIYLDGAYVTGGVGVELRGALHCKIAFRGDRWRTGIAVVATATAGATQNSAFNDLDVVILNGVNGITFQGDGTYFASNNRIRRFVWAGVGSLVSIGINFIAYCDNDITEQAFCNLNYAGSIAALYNSANPTGDVQVYENHFTYLVAESDVAGTIAIKGNHTWQTIGLFPSRVTLRASGSQPPSLSISGTCDIEMRDTNDGLGNVTTAFGSLVAVAPGAGDNSARVPTTAWVGTALAGVTGGGGSTTGVKKVLVSSDYGFPTDGTTACDSALASMFTAANARGGAEIYLDAAVATTYTFASTFTLPNNCDLTSRPSVTITSPASTLLNIGSNCRVMNVRLNSTVGSGGTLINIPANATNWELSNITFDALHSHSIVCNALGVADGIIRNNRFVNGGYGALFNSAALDIKRISIYENTFYPGINSDPIALNFPSNQWTTPPTTGVANSGSGGGSYFDIHDNRISTTITGSTSTSSGFGVSVAGGSHVNIHDNLFYSIRQQGIHIEDNSQDITISGNIIDTVGGQGGSPSVNNDGINMLSCPNLRAVVTGNVIRNVAAVGINFDYDSTHYVAAVVVSNNMVSASVGSGIALRGSVNTSPQNVIITGNIVTAGSSNGIATSGQMSGVRIESNICDGNTGYGVSLSTGGRMNAIVNRNTLTNNTAGPYNFVYQAGAPLPMEDFSYTTALASSASTGTGTVSLGLMGANSSGTLYLYAQRGSAYTTKVYRIGWNGSYLKATQIVSDSSSSSPIAIVAPTMAGYTMQTSVTDTNSTAGTINLTVQFRGTTYANLVTGSGTPLVIDEPTVVRGTAAPTAGTWAVGDLCMNTTASGTPVAWTCTVAGTPGTWTALAASGGSSNTTLPAEDLPTDHGYRGWTDRVRSVTGTMALTSGVLYYGRIKVMSAGAINNIINSVTVAGSGLTVNKLALFDLSGNQLGVTADGGATVATSTNSFSLTSATAAQTAGTYILVAMLFIGTTPPTVRTSGNTAPLVNIGLSYPYFWGTFSAGTYTDMPSTLTLSSSAATSTSTVWAAVS